MPTVKTVALELSLLNFISGRWTSVDYIHYDWLIYSGILCQALHISCHFFPAQI